LGGTEGIDTVFLFTLPKGSRHFLLIDDVITGSTLEACSRALLKKFPIQKVLSVWQWRNHKIE
jgi:predicted amidophosphoribosyltransferase